MQFGQRILTIGILVIIEINKNIGTKWVNVVDVNDYLCILKNFLVIAYKTVVKGKSQLLQVKGGLSKKKINFKKIIFIYFNESPFKNDEKCFLFYDKSSFRSWYIYTFVGNGLLRNLWFIAKFMTSQTRLQ